MSSGGEPGGKFFCEGLEPAVIRRDAAGPKDRQFHRVRIIDYAFYMQDVLKHCQEQLSEALTFLEQMVSMESPTFDKGLTDKFVLFLMKRFHDRFQPSGAAVASVPVEKFGNHLRVNLPGKSPERVLL